MSEQVLCYHCNEPIETRDDLIVTISRLAKAAPYHVTCYHQFTDSKRLGKLIHPIIGSQTTDITYKINRLIIFGIRAYIAIVLLASIITSIIIKPFNIYILLIGLISIGLPLIWLSYFYHSNKLNEKLEEDAWELYESKLPPRKL